MRKNLHSESSKEAYKEYYLNLILFSAIPLTGQWKHEDSPLLIIKLTIIAAYYHRMLEFILHMGVYPVIYSVHNQMGN